MGYSRPSEGIWGTVAKKSAPIWMRSSKCAASSCVEVASMGSLVLVRDSKAPDTPYLSYTSEEWQAFIAGVKAGEFDAYGSSR